MKILRDKYGELLQETLVSFINNECTKERGSLLYVMKHGVEILGHKLELMYNKPETTFNKDLIEKYGKNRFSVMEEVWANDKERIDVVIFLNGFAIISMELKCNFAGQSVKNAMEQYTHERDPKSRLLLFNAGTIVNFAMDLKEVYMTTKLDKDNTYFLPFNQGKGKGADAGAGNSLCEDDYPVHYMWNDILTEDTILDLISKYIFIQTIERTKNRIGRNEVKQTLIFPRYHQFDTVRKLIADVSKNLTSYLIQHSAGSGKTNTIAWLAYRLATLHDENNKIIFDNVVIMTVRVVVDRQLQKSVMGMEHKSGLIRVMDEKCTSADLANALKGNTKIIATTIQKFPHITDCVKGLKNKRFAVIIDEAHSSTACKNMAAVTQSLGMGEEVYQDMEDKVCDEFFRNGKQSNVSMFAFTATPKATTLSHFCTPNEKGNNEPFHVYSMNQAIEEGFILDVLENYITYKTFYQINKEIEEDPKIQTSSAKCQIARFVALHETNISQHIEITVEHFCTTVMHEFDGQAKSMVVTNSRQSAAKYRQALTSLSCARCTF